MPKTDVKETEQKIRRLSLVLHTIRNVNQLLVQEKDLNRLLQGICGTLVENRGYQNVWIALLDKTGKLMTTAESGVGEKFTSLVKRLNRGGTTDCFQRAMTQEGVLLIDDPSSVCTDCPLSMDYTGRSAMASRLEYNGNIHGVLCVSIQKNIMPDSQEQVLVHEISNAIAERIDRIIEYRQAEEALFESEERFRNVVENSLTGISIIQDGQVVYQNPEQERLFGRIPRPAILASLEDIHPADADNIKDLYQNITSGKVKSFETDFRFFPDRKSSTTNRTVWVNCRASLIEFNGRNAILTNAMDVSRTRELENMLRVQDKMSSLGRVAAGIAHEIRNPLSGINIYLNTLEKMYEHPDDLSKVRGILRQLQSASNKIESVIKRVMDFAKPGEPRFVSTDINKPIEEAIQLSAVTLRKNGIKIEQSLTGDLPRCQADPNLIEELVLNLINNAAEAMKHMNRNKIIEIASSYENGLIRLTFSDSGPGIPIDIRNKILDPFYTTKADGTGIGLSIGHRIITDHDGTLKISNSKLGGAEFLIEFPIKKIER